MSNDESSVDRKYVRRAETTAYRLIDGVALIVCAEDGKLRSLNKVGSFIWEIADGTRTLREIAVAVSSDFDVSPERAASDAAAFIMDLMERKLVTLTDHPYMAKGRT